MGELPCVLLRHEAHGGTHYDWLLVDPADPGGPLWTARVGHPSGSWATIGRWTGTVIGRHRRVYLTRQGPIGGGRGRVWRVDSGHHEAELWAASRWVLRVRMREFAGVVEGRRLAGNFWGVTVLGLGRSGAGHCRHP